MPNGEYPALPVPAVTSSSWVYSQGANSAPSDPNSTLQGALQQMSIKVQNHDTRIMTHDSRISASEYQARLYVVTAIAYTYGLSATDIDRLWENLRITSGSGATKPSELIERVESTIKSMGLGE